MKWLILSILAITISSILFVNIEAGANGKPTSFPIRLPYLNATLDSATDHTTYDKDFKNCMIYMEGVTVIGINHNKDKSSGQKAVFALVNGSDNDPQKMDTQNKYSFDPSFAICHVVNGSANPQGVDDQTKNQSYVEFSVQLALNSKGVAFGDGSVLNTLAFTLHFDVPSLDNWYLAWVRLDDFDVTGSTRTDGFLKSAKLTDFNSTSLNFDQTTSFIRGFYGYSYGCSAAPGLFFETKDNSQAFGLQFVNFQIEPYNLAVKYTDDTTIPTPGKTVKAVEFKHMVNDCVPTFSVGSWMSIISALVLAAVFMFGFLMLNSIQTMDRFDDPKQKQIVINTKE